MNNNNSANCRDIVCAVLLLSMSILFISCAIKINMVHHDMRLDAIEKQLGIKPPQIRDARKAWWYGYDPN